MSSTQELESNLVNAQSALEDAMAVYKAAKAVYVADQASGATFTQLLADARTVYAAAQAVAEADNLANQLVTPLQTAADLYALDLMNYQVEDIDNQQPQLIDDQSVDEQASEQIIGATIAHNTTI